MRYNPDTRISTPIDDGGLRWIVALLPDGTILLEAPDGRLHVMDPDTNESAPIEDSDSLRLEQNPYFLPAPGLSCDSNQDGPVVLSSPTKNGWFVLRRGSKRFDFLPFRIQEKYLYGLPDERALMLVNGDRLVALDLKTGERTLLFPLDHMN